MPMGQWSPVYDWPQVAIHLHLLPNGKVMSWADENDSHQSMAPGSGIGFTVDIPPGGAPGPFSKITNDTTNVFCSAHSFLADGRLFVTGGEAGGNTGVADTNIYDFRTNTWEKVAPMNAPRWYPTNTTLANGDVLTVGGSIVEEINLIPQVWSVDRGWRDLADAQREVQLYSPMHLAPNGKVFMSGTSPLTAYLDTRGTGEWTDVAWHNWGRTRDYGSSVMYGDGKIIMIGGGDPPTNTAEIIDLYEDAPRWKWTAPMQYARRHMNATLMADGKVLVTNGTSSPGFNDATEAVLPAEVWDPQTGRWATMASAQIPRVYHSTAILLSDARVLVAGGGKPAPVNGVDNYNAEIFSPPYLFNGPRPEITTAPESIGYGQEFFIGTPDSSSIVKATWIRLSSVTHANNMNQRINHLAVTPASGGVNIVAPSNRNLTPPGHYMLFLINEKGVPSIAKIIQIV